MQEKQTLLNYASYSNKQPITTTTNNKTTQAKTSPRDNYQKALQYSILNINFSKNYETCKEF